MQELFDGIIELTQDKDFINELENLIEEETGPEERNWISSIMLEKIRFMKDIVHVIYKVTVNREFSDDTWSFMYDMDFLPNGEPA